jgi:LPS export ABC transporter protein LptC
MSKLKLNKIFIFIAIAVLVSFFIRTHTKKVQEGLLKERELPEVAEGFQALKDTEGQIKIDGLHEEQKILSFDMVGYSKDGRKKWDIQGKSADIVADTVILSDIKANVYNEDRTVALIANSGRYNKKENSIMLEKNVILTTSDDVILVTEWIKWESETDIITTDTFLEVKKGDLYASGCGALASTKNKEIKLEKDIVVTQGDITISCNGPLAIDYDNNRASFYDRVKVIEPRGELIADRMDIFFNPESRKIEKAVAEKNVELKHGQNIATGQKIVYTLASGEAILTGNPEILIYSKKDLDDAFTGN